ncbi:MAG: AmpG family muropeptide MFS transporter [Rhodospirillaceae bacterium]|jgi:MFS transporter, PAT family, beta-lactamase induction signal transducer AmpG|nr:AmpG family muropeptide MFS transporter [Rhodospirillaceae bacterium]MBT5240821.1 AmpG family muropeptide MFS transporter [Rhodospirillaceae bacterium]MBT5564709.1 AmpG family muropeptide MFS transporter [Rhodospirillaceae bacterium]MBT6090158.1 AmpG family muropeptide MFS transporter [Rhodospirillaceae bacterium]MBT7449257.1 AmpG family muropeptide MFS transporter [Rhodospirillaceae bacterium]
MTGQRAKDWIAASRVYFQRRLIIIFLLGFAAGLPFLLMFGTLTAWLSQAGIDKTSIGLFVLTGTAFTLKFLWAPLVDRLPLPIVTRLFGQRRSWLILAQVICISSLVGIALSDPTVNLATTVLWTVILAFASATQDIVIDAYRIETLNENEQGAGAAVYQLGYRLALIAAGAGALILADAAGWTITYITMAALMAVGLVTTLFSPEPMHPPQQDDTSASRIVRYTQWIKESVVAPFVEFFSRPGALAILLFVVFYKYADGIWAAMANPFYLELGFTLTEIGVVSKTYGVVMTIIGSILGGVMVLRIGILKSVLFGVISMALTNLLYAALALAGPSVPVLMAVISIENLANGIGGTAFIAYLSSLCNLAYTATQYALLSSFMNVARTFLAAGGGWLADQVDWFTFFILTTVAGIPGILLLLYLMKRFPTHTETARQNDTV